MSTEIFQFLLQLLASEEDAAFHRTQRQTQLVGYLTILES